VRVLHAALTAEDIPIELSLTAGAYLCNQMMYHALQVLDGTGIPTGFIHLPRSFSDPDAELDIDLPKIEAGVRRLVELLAMQLPALAPMVSVVEA
jgi:pyroglutamyl-peptidase